MPGLLLISGVFLSVFLLLVGIFVVIGRKTDPALRRIKEFGEDEPEAEGRGSRAGIKKELISRKVGRAVAGLGNLTGTDEEKLSDLKELLIQAGFRSEQSVRIFKGIKILSALILFVVFLFLGILAGRSLAIVLILDFLIGFVGYKLPDIILGFVIRRRQRNIAGGLPDAIDLLVITVEAGLGLNAAILRVGADLKLRCPLLAQELLLVNQDLRTGIARETALRNLSKRNPIEDLRIFVGALVLADRLGTSIADTLRTQASSLRTRVRQKAEEQAAKAGIKMLLPLVLFILPALIIILMGPGVLSVIKALNP